MTAHRPLLIDGRRISRLRDGDTLLLPSVTALRLLGVDNNKSVISINLAAFIKGIGTLQVQDDGAGGVIMTVPQTLTVKLLGDNDAAVAGNATDAPWDGVAPSSTWTSLWKAAVTKLEAIRVLLAGTIKVDPKQFCPSATIKLTAGVSSVSAALSTGTTALRIFNSGPSTVFVRWGTGAQTATTGDLPIASGASESFGKLSAHDTIAAISSGMATLYVSSGNRV
ncbi:MAG: hypothetical protein WCF85_10625 [Rhodospirillaceae bacterium]